MILYVLLVPCFENIAMSGDSPKSEVVQMCFIKLREFMTDRRHIISQAINNHDDLKIYNDMNVIYFFAVDKHKTNVLKLENITNCWEIAKL